VSEDFKVEPYRHMNELVEWLGMDPTDIKPKYRYRGSAARERPRLVHVREYDGYPTLEVQQKLRDWYAPHNQRLFEMLRDKGFGEVAARLEEVWARPLSEAPLHE
jgi:hypothetical protein